MKADRREFVAMCGGALVQTFLDPRLAEAKPGEGSDAAPSDRQKVIIDTDPGVDDAFALLLALASPELDVLAVTAVAGNVPIDYTLPNALRMVEIAGRTDVPVAGGAAAPLVRKLIDATYAHGVNGLAGVEFPAPNLKPASEPAATLIDRMVRANPGEVIIVGIGPLTNVAMALHQYPDLATMIRGIVLMGGSLSGGNITPSAEFNCFVDPEAASIVFGAGVPIRMVGLDVTRKINLTEERVAALRAGRGPVSNAAARIGAAVLEVYRRKNTEGSPHLHDPLAVSALLSSKILTFEDFHVEIETTGTLTAGESVAWRRPPVRFSAPLRSCTSMATEQINTITANAKVATGVDPELFFNLLIPRLTKSRA